jgi:hypothetical protein
MLMFITIYRHATARMDRNSARGIFFSGFLDLVAEETDVVVSADVVGGDQHGSAEPAKKVGESENAPEANRMPDAR